MFVCCECCVLSGRGLCDGLITRSEESYRLWRVVVCDQETSQARRQSPLEGCKIQPPMGVVAPGEKKLLVKKGIYHTRTHIETGFLWILGRASSI